MEGVKSAHSPKLGIFRVKKEAGETFDIEIGSNNWNKTTFLFRCKHTPCSHC